MGPALGGGIGARNDAQERSSKFESRASEGAIPNQSSAPGASGAKPDPTSTPATDDPRALALDGLGKGASIESAGQLDLTGGGLPDATTLAAPNLRLPNALAVASPTVIADNGDTLLLLSATFAGLLTLRRRLTFWA
ncbi:MAG: hypothetical protein ABIZ04_19475 [Opitutus sp.]